jgi:phospholipid-binding lipoprotein MlaA
MVPLIRGASTAVRAFAVIAVLLMSAGCATTPGRTKGDDPWQGMNRGIYKFNDTVDRAALKPVAKGYRKITPHWLRAGIGNFFSNLTYPATIANQLLQGKLKMGTRDTGRFLVNSTIGIGGLLDVATRLGLQANDEDFGQTLAVWGVGSGPYVTLPFFGPSSLRDAPSRIFDYFLGPLVYLDVPWQTEWGLRALDIVHMRSELLPLDPTLQKAFDPYAFIRDAWVQKREFEIYDGNPPPDEPENFMEEDDSAAPEQPPESSAEPEKPPP